MYYYAGDKPGAGKYKCVDCDEKIKIEDDTQTLPVCPKCFAMMYEKIE